MNKAPPSPKLMRLDADIKAEKDPVRAGCLRAERAGLLGRLGFFAEAKSSLNALQKDFSRNPNATVSIWMQIAEGWICFYDEDLITARDHFMRADALARACGCNDLVALSASWLANLSYLRDDFHEMGRHLECCINLAAPDDHLTQTRLCMVFALAYFFADRYDLAQPWFSKTRGHAAASNDEAALSALNYNMTTRRVYHLMVASIQGQSLEDSEALAKIGIESINVFDHILGIALVGDWNHAIEANFHSACGRYERAVEIYDEHIPTLPKYLAQFKSVYLADSAWCHANIGQSQSAIDLARDAEKLITSGLNVEDLYLIHGRLRQVFDTIGNGESSERHRCLEAQSYANLQASRAEVLRVLSRLH